jgi:hypothetical protein
MNETPMHDRLLGLEAPGDLPKGADVELQHPVRESFPRSPVTAAVHPQEASPEPED